VSSPLHLRQAEWLPSYPLGKLFEPSVWVERLHTEDRKRVLELRVRPTQEGRSHDTNTAAAGRVVWLRHIVTIGVEDESPPGSAPS
jgi:hypothetical protein